MNEVNILNCNFTIWNFSLNGVNVFNSFFDYVSLIDDDGKQLSSSAFISSSQIQYSHFKLFYVFVRSSTFVASPLVVDNAIESRFNFLQK